MLVLAQEAAGADVVARIVSISAVAVAATSLVWSWWQGRALRRIQTTQHEWETIDRVSAPVEVTAQHHRETYTKDGRVTHSTQSWLRLRNSGRAIAREVTWEAEIDVLLGSRDSLEELHPGEHYDVYYAMALGNPPGWLFTVEWTDDRGRHSTQRRIN